MKTLLECLRIARNLDLDYVDFERISDLLVSLTFTPFRVSWASFQVLEERFGDSLWDYRVRAYTAATCELIVTVRPSNFDLL